MHMLACVLQRAIGLIPEIKLPRPRNNTINCTVLFIYSLVDSVQVSQHVESKMFWRRTSRCMRWGSAVWHRRFAFGLNFYHICDRLLLLLPCDLIINYMSMHWPSCFSWQPSRLLWGLRTALFVGMDQSSHIHMIIAKKSAMTC